MTLPTNTQAGGQEREERREPGMHANVKIKICGLTCPQDMEAVNAAKPDYCGFIINVPGSRRSVALSQVLRLRKLLADDILPVGVFVNEDPETVISLLCSGVIGAAQLHGQEDGVYLDRLRERVLQISGKEALLIKAFDAASPGVLKAAEATGADYPLFDRGKGGTGLCFDWKIVRSAKRPFFLAGGLHPGNLREAVRALKPFAVDLSSGVETEGHKDPGKILSAVKIVRGIRGAGERGGETPAVG